MRVICVRWGDKYGPDYVYRLKRACERNLPAHTFVCVTDDPLDDVTCVDLVCDLPGWWQKVGLFRPALFPGNNLYLDLDVVLAGKITSLLDAFYEDPFKLWALDDFSYSLVNPKPGLGPETLQMLGGYGTVNSSVMLWRDPHPFNDFGPSRVWSEFRPELMDVLHGDQNWITQCLWNRGLLKLLPTGVAESYKYGGRRCAPLVVFHGDPKPHEVSESWVRDHWR